MTSTRQTLALLWSGVVLIVFLAAAPIAAQPGQEQETSVPGTTARLAVIKVFDNVLLVSIAFKNNESKESELPPVQYGKVTLVDSNGSAKHFPLKATNGHYLAGPISDWGDGGRWFPKVPAHGGRVMFALFEPLKPGTKVTLAVPGLPTFDDVDLMAMAAAPSDDAGMPRGAFSGSVVSSTRSNNKLKVRMQVTRGPSGYVETAGIKYEDVSVLDPVTGRQYGLMKDADGMFIAQPVTDQGDGGRFFFNSVAVNGRVNFDLTFTPPPDTTSHVLLLMPTFMPAPVTIQGTAGAADAGASTSGRTIGLEQALSDLKADVTPERVKIALAADVLFDFDKAELKPAAETALAPLVTVVKAYPDSSVDIEGHTDGKGTDSYNQPLSERRAQAVAEWLTTHASLDSSHVHARGWGKTKPIAPNTKPDGSDDPEGRAKNRRVEVVITRHG